MTIEGATTHMNYRRTIASAAFLCLVFFLAASAANAFQRVSKAEERSQHLKGLLQLTEEQTNQVHAILKNHEAAPTAGKTTESRRMRSKAERIERAAVDKEIEALLSPEQMKKYESYKKARRSDSDQRKQPRGEEYH